MDNERDKDFQGCAPFLKHRWLYVSVGVVVLLCGALGVFLIWRANQPVETKTVYALPVPNPDRAKILEHASQSHTHDTVKDTVLPPESHPDTAIEAVRVTKSPPKSPGSIRNDLELKQAELDKWAADFMAQYPNLAYTQALVDKYQKTLDSVIGRYEQLQNQGVSEAACKKRLIVFVETILPRLYKETARLYLDMMRESVPTSVEVNRYLLENDLMPLPSYLLGQFDHDLHHNHNQPHKH